MRSFLLCAVLAGMAWAALAADASACRWRRRCYAPVVYYCSPATAKPEAAGPTSPGSKSPEEFLKDMQGLAKVIAKPLLSSPKMSPAVTRVLGAVPK